MKKKSSKDPSLKSIRREAKDVFTLMSSITLLTFFVYAMAYIFSRGRADITILVRMLYFEIYLLLFSIWLVVIACSVGKRAIPDAGGREMTTSGAGPRLLGPRSGRGG